MFGQGVFFIIGSFGKMGIYSIGLHLDKSQDANTWWFCLVDLSLSWVYDFRVYFRVERHVIQLPYTFKNLIKAFYGCANHYDRIKGKRK
jgi:hypothetical protein